MPARHKTGQDVERCLVFYGRCDLPVIPVTDDDTPAHEIRDVREVSECGGNRFDAKLREEFFNIDGLVVRPGIDLVCHEERSQFDSGEFDVLNAA